MRYICIYIICIFEINKVCYKYNYICNCMVMDYNDKKIKMVIDEFWMCIKDDKVEWEVRIIYIMYFELKEIEVYMYFYYFYGLYVDRFLINICY